MPILIQDPAIPGTPFLHEALLDKCEGAVSGGGAFAFVSRAGAELLLGDPVFRSFAAASHFDLIVGVDAVTDVAALNTLTRLRAEFPMLKARVFFHEKTSALFHPKFCWFRHRKGGFLIVGSGNLTTGGLRGNWEAFTVSALSASEIREVEAQWSMWSSVHTLRLKNTDDSVVLARAALNVRSRKTLLPIREAPQEQIALEPQARDQLAGDVLVAEIPRASDRWNQGNFTYDNFQTFFGMGSEGLAESERRILMRHVGIDGSLETLESRPGVTVKSRNFRFELKAASGLEYPDKGRPTGVFVKTGDRTFIYRLVMPGDHDYEHVSAFLRAEWRRQGSKGREDSMRRIQTNVESLRVAWPDSPLWKAYAEVDD